MRFRFEYESGDDRFIHLVDTKDPELSVREQMRDGEFLDWVDQWVSDSVNWLDDDDFPVELALTAKDCVSIFRLEKES